MNVYDIPVLFQVRAPDEDNAAGAIVDQLNDYSLAERLLRSDGTTIESWYMPKHPHIDGSDPVPQPAKPFVLISVRDGVADWFDSGVEVDIIDWDDLNDYSSYTVQDLEDKLATLTKTMPADMDGREFILASLESAIRNAEAWETRWDFQKKQAARDELARAESQLIAAGYRIEKP